MRRRLRRRIGGRCARGGGGRLVIPFVVSGFEKGGRRDEDTHHRGEEADVEKNLLVGQQHQRAEDDGDVEADLGVLEPVVFVRGDLGFI